MAETDSSEQPSNGAAGAGESSGADEVSRPNGKSRDWMSPILGILVWVGIAWFGYYVFWAAREAEVLLEIRTERPLVVSGIVTHKGGALTHGVVRVAVEDAKKDRFISSVVLPIGKDGRFSTQGQALVDETDAKSELRITARFRGGEKEDKIVGEAVAYTNFSPPFLGRHIWWAGWATSLVLTLLMIFLFTGEMGRVKARWLFASMYLMTFLSLAIPLWVAVLLYKNDALMEILKSAPIGLVKGQTDTLKEPQWLVHVGGAVVDVRAPPPERSPAKGTGSPAKDAAQTGDGGADSASAAQAGAGAKAPLAQAPAPPLEPEITTLIKGGLTIPFYVIALAMLGAGINMTRKVPEIQARYDLELLPKEESLKRAATRIGTLGIVRTAPQASVSDEPANPYAARATAAGIRRELVENYMYLLSAPFLAVAVYYLLRILTTNGDVAQPILVLMAFATGLTSDTIVKALIDFAKDKLGQAGDKLMGMEPRRRKEDPRPPTDAQRARAERKPPHGAGVDAESAARAEAAQSAAPRAEPPKRGKPDE